MTWDPQTYLAFDKERTRPAAELLARIPLEAPDYVVDLGCGPGNSTALLAARWTHTDIEGIDSSAEMLEKARSSKIAARWTHADIAQWRPSKPPGLIYANAAFQWVTDHASLIPRLASYLSSSGFLAFQVPRNFDEPCHTLIHDLAAKGPWAHQLKSVHDWWNVLSPEEYFAILEPYCDRIDIWETRYLQTLNGEDAVYRWMTGTGLRPYVAALDGPEREDFLAEYRRLMAEAYPPRKTGVTLYPFRRLFCVAGRRA
jgi:trans-aconitate 2-methyltransferase